MSETAQPETMQKIKDLAEDLKQNYCCSGGKEKDPKEAAKVLHELGNLFRTLADGAGQLYEKQMSLIRSGVLLRGAYVREPENAVVIDEDFNQLSSHVLKLAAAEQQDANLKKQIEITKETAGNIRKFAQEQLDSILSTDDKMKRVKKVEEIQQEITSQYTAMMDGILKYCIQVMGTPPCKYALAGMGSLARKEITPYSDFEHVYLLEDKVQESPQCEEIKDYFRWLSVVFQFVIIGIGETLIPTVCIPFLNGQSSIDGAGAGEDWFYDAYTPRGISFDGMLPQACKFPLGRPKTLKKRSNAELIRSVSNMLDYLSSEEDIKNGYHLADILTKTCFVSGDTEIFEEFRSKSVILGSLNKSQLREQTQRDLKQLVSEFTKCYTSDKEIHFKKIVYRSISLYIAALGRLNKVERNSSFDIIRELKNESYLEPVFADDLIKAAALTCELRLKLYLQHNRQADSYPAGEHRLTLLEILGEENAIFCLKTSFELQILLEEKLDIKLEETLDDYKLLGDAVVYRCLTLHQRCIDRCKELLLSAGENLEIRLKCYIFMAACYVSLKQYLESVNMLEKWTEEDGNKEERFSWSIDICKNILNNTDEFSSVNNRDWGTERSNLVHLNCSLFQGGYCHMKLKQYPEAIACFERAKTDSTDEPLFRAACSFLIAQCQVEAAKQTPKTEI